MNTIGFIRLLLQVRNIRSNTRRNRDQETWRRTSVIGLERSRSNRI